MRRLVATALFAVTSFGVTSLAAAPRTLAAQDVGLEVGTRAPAAAVQTLDGRPADLAQYVGKGPVLVEFWATWCPSCRELQPKIDAAARKYAGRVQFVTVAVSVNQSPARVKAHVAKHRTPGVVLFDKSGAATGAYDVPATSYVLVLDKAGKVVYTGQGADQDIDAAIRKAM